MMSPSRRRQRFVAASIVSTQRLHLLATLRAGRAGPQNLGRDGRMDDVQVLTERGSGEGLPSVVARQVEYPTPQPVEFQVLVECEVDLGDLRRPGAGWSGRPS